MRTLPLVFAAVLAAALAVAGCASSPHPHTPVSVSVSSCGRGWTHTAAGSQRVVVRNTDSRSGEAQLIDPKSGAIYADIEPLGPGTTADVDVSLSAGRYEWRCLMEDEPAVDGPTVTLTGSAHGTTPGVAPVNQADLIPATQAYERYVSGQLPLLSREVAGLRAAVADPARAEQAWLVAHLEYERLGAAYDAFGDLDADINGLPNGLPGGVHDPHWTGFHRIEYSLWHHTPTATVRAEVVGLATSVHQLAHQFATAQIDPLQIGIRAHEIAENALQFELTGRTDFGSNSQLQTVRANLEGTQTVLGIVHSLLAPRYPQLGAAENALHQAETDIDDSASHERIDADLSELCELLAPVASILEPRKTQ
jgi:iron uptake system component EfeO